MNHHHDSKYHLLIALMQVVAAILSLLDQHWPVF